MIYCRLTQHDFLPPHPSLRKYTGKGIWCLKQKSFQRTTLLKISLLSQRLSQVAAEVTARFEGFRGSAQPPHLCTHMQNSYSWTVLKVKAERSSMGTERRTVLPPAREELRELGGGGGLSFLVFSLLLTTITVYIYASHCWVIWTILFMYRILNPFQNTVFGHQTVD